MLVVDQPVQHRGQCSGGIAPRPAAGLRRDVGDVFGCRRRSPRSPDVLYRVLGTPRAMPPQGRRRAGRLGPRHSRSANSGSAVSPRGQARKTSRQPAGQQTGINRVRRLEAERVPRPRPGSTARGAGCQPGRRTGGHRPSASPSCAGRCPGAGGARAAGTADGPRRSAAHRQRSRPARPAMAAHLRTMTTRAIRKDRRQHAEGVRPASHRLGRYEPAHRGADPNHAVRLGMPRLPQPERRP